jgi:anti-sigma B factor antagonist
MRDPERLTRPVIVPLPGEIDIANAGHVGEQLRAAFAAGVTIVIADLGSTVFCDCSGVRQLMRAYHRAVAAGAELRVVARSAAVLRVLRLLGADRVLQVYPSLPAALMAGPDPGPG